MVNENIFQCDSHEAERNAYNAAFYEMGFRWYWDCEIYAEIMKAYEAAFLAKLIEKAQLRKRLSTRNTAPSAHFNWAETLAGEIGA